MMLPLCQCGCGQEVTKEGNLFVNGHNWRGRKFSREHKRKISEALRSREFSDETKRKMSVAKKGKPLSLDHRRKISEANIGKKHSLASRRKMSIAQKGKPKSKEHRAKLSIAREGKKLTAEHRKKIGIASTGRKHTEETKRKIAASRIGRKNPMYGKPVSEETRRKLSIANRGKKQSEEAKRKISFSRMGDKNPAWNGGSSFKPYSLQFNKFLKREIRERDNLTCQLCKTCQDKLNHTLCVHHIDYDKMNCSKSNLITLCRSCNTKSNGNRKYWQSFFEQFIETKFKHEWLRPVHRLETVV